MFWTELNQQIAEALGYTVRTESDESAHRAVIVAPNGLELWYTESDSKDWTDREIGLDQVIRWAWHSLFDPYTQDDADEAIWDDIPEHWSGDATAASNLFGAMEKPDKSEKLRLDIEYCFMIPTHDTEKKWMYTCRVWLNGNPSDGWGEDELLAGAICKAWLKYKKVEVYAWKRYLGIDLEAQRLCVKLGV